MARTHDRSETPDPDAHAGADAEPALLKRMKMSHIAPVLPEDAADPALSFAPEVLHPATIHRLNHEYNTSTPYKYALVEKLFQDDLLVKVKDEILAELSFAEKETDIYKVKQTGDLASLSFLTDEQRALLPGLLALRDALYSPTFRAFLRAVTGCGPLSGTKQDMSVVSYTRGCHLLNHDDVIGSRRVSYILYMPLPHFRGWRPEWGGALEMYPVHAGPDGVPEPLCAPSASIPPSWNQFVFFEVQPGQSFHSVEEVVVGEGEDGRQRLSISGWFHAAQPGEEGYEPEPTPALKSSREQLTSTSTEFKSYPDSVDPPLPDDPLSEEDTSFLSEFLNPVYLQARTMKALAARFVEESSLELHSFLCQPLADKLGPALATTDAQDGLGPLRAPRIPPHAAGTERGWLAKGPPHKWRYCVLREPNGPRSAADPRWAHAAPDEIVRSLQDELFPSPAFRAWLAAVSRLLPLRHAVEARRFRPGLDYTLATSEAREARLDVVLGLTPQAQEDAEAAEGDGEPRGWQSGEWGGWECYMAPHDEEDDPAVYRSGSTKTKSGKASNGSNGTTNGNGSSGHASGAKHDDGEDHMQEDEEEEEEDGTLLTVQPGFNRLLLVLRDEGVMRFVKYVSAAADGSRWDICGEFEVGMVEEEQDA